MKVRKVVLALGLSLCSVLWAQSGTDSESIAELFYTLNGDAKDPHKKINHTKGFCAIGELVPVKDITKTYDIPLLKESAIPTQVRFSLGGGNPNASDGTKGRYWSERYSFVIHIQPGHYNPDSLVGEFVAYMYKSVIEELRFIYSDDINF